jgi:ABC-type transport system involved in multi-copper enzyme maturation permease subunit
MMRAWIERANTWRRRQPWALWRAQVWSIVRIEWKRNFRSRRGAWTFVLAFAPAAIIALHAAIDRSHSSIGEDTSILAGIFQLYYVRLGLFFGTLGIFTRLIRGKMIERSLHYYLLAPVRREVLVIGQFLAGALSALVLFEAGAFVSFAIMYGNFGAVGREFVFQGPGLGHLGAYLLIVALGCMGYGAVFLLFSMTFKNPMVPAMLVMAWEAVNPVLPTLLQRISVASYLRHLMPVQVRAEGVFALLTVITEPVRPWAAVIGVLCVTVVVVVACCYRIRSLEISYTTD